MFKPRYTITHATLNRLTQIARAQEVIQHAHLVPKWEISLRREAIIRQAHASTSIEGNPLSLEQVSDLAHGRTVMAARRAKQEVINYLGVLEHLHELSPGEKITEAQVLAVHRWLTRGMLDNPKYVGAYRKMQVVVANRLTREVIFRPPQAKDVPRLMKEFTSWLNVKQTATLNPVLAAGIAHYEFVRIHPFVDGNGRTARTLATLILYKRGFDTKRFFALDDYYDSDRPAYYAALNNVNPKTQDLTAWLEYFAEGVAVSVEQVREKVLRLSRDSHKRAQTGQVALSERQMRIVEFLHDRGRMTNKELRSMLKVSRQAALKELNKLIQLDVIHPEGHGRSLHYVLS
ncbi:MAG: Fic family protein [Candidatus Omnitrophica bacterium]|nr:Fic family protein [Candidatus Omnitrophota bacterium]